MKKDGKKSAKLRNIKRIEIARQYEQIILPKDEYAHVMSELNSHLSEVDRDKKVIVKPILMSELKSIYDDKDFVCGTVTIAKTKENWQEILDYIQTMKEDGEAISSDDIILLAMALRREADEKKASTGLAGRLTAAML